MGRRRPPTAKGWGEELLDRAVRHRPHGPGRSYMPARDRTTPDRLLGPGRWYIDRTGPGDVESTDRDYSESLVRT